MGVMRHCCTRNFILSCGSYTTERENVNTSSHKRKKTTRKYSKIEYKKSTREIKLLSIKLAANKLTCSVAAILDQSALWIILGDHFLQLVCAQNEGRAYIREFNQQILQEQDHIHNAF